MVRAARRLDWRSGGLLLLLSAGLVVAAVAWRIPALLRDSTSLGNGRDPQTYGFDLETTVEPLVALSASGMPRDGIATLDAPEVMAAAEVATLNAEHRGKYLVPADRVVGVVIGGQARAYPLRVLNWHEVVNDRVGGVPIAVTFSPLCDAVGVFDRRVGTETLELGVSGLLLDSNLLLYDRRNEPGASSLWSQLQARAVAGPAAAAGQELRVLPASLTRWDRWTTAHPDSTVLRPDVNLLKRYGRDPYGSYWSRGRPRFPVEPMAAADRAVSPLAEIVMLAGGEPRGPFVLGGEPLTTLLELGFEIDSDGDRHSVLAPPELETGVLYSRWFAWHGQHPRDQPVRPR